ncbi:hypothetical protein JL722_14295 [Aureococcus anophagefferens]|nr:hypothetical protein JL722_14295 [Aureococcus anophagefferens]
MKLIVAVAVASTASAFLRASPGAAPPSLRAKKDKAADGDAAPVEVNALGKGSIVEFEFNKHTCIGVVDAHMVKAKGGLRYDVVTADEKVFSQEIAKLFDEGTSPVDLYRTFRIMTSELGRVFKSAKGEAAAFKARRTP